MKMMKDMRFKPKDLKELVEQEPRSHKIRIVCFSLLMGAISGTYRYFFDSVVARSAGMQMQALAQSAELKFPDYIDPNSREVWTKRKTLGVLKSKSFDDLLRIENNWHTTEYRRTGTQADWQTPGQTSTYTEVYTNNPNGDPKVGTGYYT